MFFLLFTVLCVRWKLALRSSLFFCVQSEKLAQLGAKPASGAERLAFLPLGCRVGLVLKSTELSLIGIRYSVFVQDYYARVGVRPPTGTTNSVMEIEEEI